MIGDLIKRHEEAKPLPPDDLLNGPHKDRCECGSLSCASPIGTPILQPGRFRNG